jgi:hypothetical protein
MSDGSNESFGRHSAAQHAMQAGVSLEQEQRPQANSPKHLRVGINTALCDHASLVKLLVGKGLITEEEYAKAIADGMEEEQRRYEERLGVRLA